MSCLRLSEVRLSRSKLSEVRLSRSKLSELRLSHSNVMFYRGKAHEIEWKHCFQLALIFYRGMSPRVEWKHCFQLALIFYRSSAHEIENFCTLSRLHVELSSLMSLLNIHLRRMQQPTEIWKKTCHRRIRHCCLRRMQQPTEM